MSTDAARPAVDPALWRTAFVLVLGTFMATIDTTIVSVALDVLADRFAVAVTDIHWVSTAYLLAVVTAVPASGWLADRFGGRRAWAAAIAVFLLASLLCALAWSLPSLIAFRVLQGAAGGLLPPLGQALLARAAGPDRVGRVISVVAVVPLLSPVLGPLAGGAILGAASWPWLFCVNIPVGAVALVLVRRCVPEGARGERGAPFDLRGAALLAPGLAALVCGLTELGHTGSAPLSAAAIALGASMLVAFVGHGLRTRGVPLIDPRLFTRPPFGVAAVALVVLGASVFGTMFLLPLYLQRAAGLTAWETGLLLAPQGVGAAAGSLWVSRVVHRVAARTLVLSGIVLVAAGTVVFTQLARGVPDALIAASLLVRGVGAAMIGAPVMTLAYRAVAPNGLPRAAGALSLLNTLGGSVGTAVLAVVLRTRFAARGPDAAAAFADAFWWVLASTVLAAVAATRLPRPRQRDRPGPLARPARRVDRRPPRPRKGARR